MAAHTRKQGGDEGMMAESPTLNYYLVTPIGTLISAEYGPTFPLAIGFAQSANPELPAGPIQIDFDRMENIRKGFPSDLDPSKYRIR